jgi:hypothetical protein
LRPHREEAAPRVNYSLEVSLRKLIVALAALVVAVAAAPASALKVPDPTPTKSFSDTKGNTGYVSVAEGGAEVRACNENEATPAGDSATGYIYVNSAGEDTSGNTGGKPTYGNSTIGASDYDGEGADDGNAENGTEEHDCP